MLKRTLAAASLCCATLLTLSAVSHAADKAPAPAKGKESTVLVTITTSMGVIELELDKAKAPLTVENFVRYAKAGHYDKTVFHRVIPGFMIQGGGFTADMTQKAVQKPVKNEGDNGLKNERGTVAMARTPDPDSATSQFFINHKNNDALNTMPGKPGYTVFGKVLKGMDVVDKIAAVPTGSKDRFENVPTTPVVMESVKVAP